MTTCGTHCAVQAAAQWDYLITMTGLPVMALGAVGAWLATRRRHG